jgi:hypothetical protein
MARSMAPEAARLCGKEMEAFGIDPAEVLGGGSLASSDIPDYPEGGGWSESFNELFAQVAGAFGIAPVRRRGYPLVERSNCPIVAVRAAVAARGLRLLGRRRAAVAGTGTGELRLEVRDYNSLTNDLQLRGLPGLVIWRAVHYAGGISYPDGGGLDGRSGLAGRRCGWRRRS